MDTMVLDQLDEIKVFFQQAQETAITYRLGRAQKEMRNYLFLEREFNLMWDTVRICYEQKDWERLLAFRETLQPFLDLRGFWEHSIILNRWAEEAALVLEDTFNEARWRHDRADMLNQQGHYREAEQLYQESETLYRRLCQDECALKSRHMRSMVVRAQGRTAEAQQLCRSTVAEARKLQLDSWLAHPLYVLALFARDQGDLQRAAALIGESITLLSGTLEDEMLGQCHAFLGELALRQRDLVKAHVHLEVSLQLVQQTSTLRLVVNVRRLLGDLALAEGHYTEATAIYSEIMMLFESKRLGDKLVLGKTLSSRAQLLIQTKQLQEAVHVLEGAISIFKELGNVRRAVDASFLLIDVHIRLGHLLRAGKYLLFTIKTAHSSGLVNPHTIFTWLRIRVMP